MRTSPGKDVPALLFEARGCEDVFCDHCSFRNMFFRDYRLKRCENHEHRMLNLSFSILCNCLTEFNTSSIHMYIMYYEKLSNNIIIYFIITVLFNFQN